MTMRDKSLVAVFACAALLVVPLVTASEPAEPAFEEKGDKLVLQNDEVTVWFQGKKPMLKVFETGSEAEAFGYRVHRLVEYQDDDGDGFPDEEEVRAFANLESAKDWAVDVNETPGRVVLTLQREVPVTVRAPLVGEEIDVPGGRAVANVTLTFHIFGEDTTLEVADRNVSVDAGAVKYDLGVERWPWADAENGRLALVVDVTGEVSTTEGADVPAAAVTRNGTAAGVLTWLPEATAFTGDANETVGVEAAFEETENGTRQAFTFNASGYDRLVYDPTVGIASTSADDEAVDESAFEGLRDVPAPTLALVGVAAAAAVALGRRD